MPADSPDVVVVSHFHWDREWYRTMQGFRARLVDAIDQVLDLAATEDDYRFLLDGQTVVLDDYLVVRPDRREELGGHIRDGRLAIGPWFVQPDSLLPSGEAHVRNLLEGRRAESEFGPVSRVAYVPDSFGHPAQFPQLFRGFALTGFVHWRGNGNELDTTGARWTWRAPDDSTIPVFHLTEGYFAASRPPADPKTAVKGMSRIIRRLQKAGEDPAIVMNGFDHTRPDAGLGDLFPALSEAADVTIHRGTLDDAVGARSNFSADGADPPEFTGELVGGRIANLLPGVWSARMPLKIRNRHIESLLEREAEPWVALATSFGLTDEAPALREAWRALLLNQAHDSICGCSIDAVHERMIGRYDDAEGLATETLERALERLAGRPADRDVPPIDDLEVVVFNSSPRPTSGVVRVALDAHPAFAVSLGVPEVHSLVEGGFGSIGFTIEGVAARVVDSDDPNRVRWLPGQAAFDVEFVAADVPAFGCRRYRLTQADPSPDTTDDGTEIEVPGTRVSVETDGTITLETDDGRWSGLFAVDDIGDRGDSYDFDAVGTATSPRPIATKVVRRSHPSGIQRLDIQRTFRLPKGLTADRTERREATVDVDLDMTVTVARGVVGVQISVNLENTARDHRLRLVLPTGGPAAEFVASTTYDLVTRSTQRADDEGWVHPAPTTFCHHGIVALNGLVIDAPGLPEAEVRPDGTALLTLVRAVGWLARYDLASRPMPAGPEMTAPGAQCLGSIRAEITLSGRGPAPVMQAGQSPLRGAVGGPEPLLAEGRPLLEIDDEHVVVTAVKPAADGDGLVVRLLNPTDAHRLITMTFGFGVDTTEVNSIESVRLDETADGDHINAAGSTVTFDVGPHQLRSFRYRPAPSDPESS